MLEKIREFARKNTNWVGTVSAVVAAVMAFMTKAAGCTITSLPEDWFPTATCTVEWVPASWLPAIGTFFAVLAIIAKITREGGWFRSLFGSTAVVVSPSSPNSGVGTVSPSQVMTR